MSHGTRRTLRVGVYAALIVLWVWPYILWQPVRLNHEGFNQIELGMTHSEVEKHLGGPPGIYYPSYQGAGGGGTDELYLHPAGSRGERWYDHRAEYTVWFGADGRVAAKSKRASWQTTTHTLRHFYFHNIWSFLAIGWLTGIILGHILSWLTTYWLYALKQAERPMRERTEQ